MNEREPGTPSSRLTTMTRYRNEIEKDARFHTNQLMHEEAEVEKAQDALDERKAKLQELREEWLAAEEDPFLANWRDMRDPSVIYAKAATELRAEANEVRNLSGDIVIEGVRSIPNTDLRDPFEEPKSFSQGLYGSEGQIFYVYLAQAGTHWLAKRVIGSAFHYAGAAERFVTPRDRMTDEQHAEFGQTMSICGYCSAGLTDGESQVRGYGPVCAKKHGLPHSGS